MIYPLELTRGVSFKTFAGLAGRMNNWTVVGLSRKFPGGFESRMLGSETSAAFFRRVLDRDPSPDVVIPYLPVVRHYIQCSREMIEKGKLRACHCGCGSPVFGHDLYAWEDCAQRAKAGVVADYQGARVKPLLPVGPQGAGLRSTVALLGDLQ